MWVCVIIPSEKKEIQLHKEGFKVESRKEFLTDILRKMPKLCCENPFTGVENSIIGLTAG